MSSDKDLDWFWNFGEIKLNTFQNFSNDLDLGKGPCVIMFKYFDMRGILFYEIETS